MLAKGASACIFCDSDEFLPPAEKSVKTQGNLALDPVPDAVWRGELNQRLQAYRARRKKLVAHEGQSALPFEEQPAPPEAHSITLDLDEPKSEVAAPRDDFAFTIAIGRTAPRREERDARLVIDVSTPPAEAEAAQTLPPIEDLPETRSMFPVAPIEERRYAALIDAACLAFAYGAFLTLFGSLGGQFTFSKLNAAVYFFTFVFVYIQYFGLFTVFGGTTPGMMIRGLHVSTFSGEDPTVRHLALRAAGYLLSAGTLFLGFFWALWDEDTLTWHDRVSGTYLSSPEPLPELDGTQNAHLH